MAAEYGASTGFFSVDDATLSYLRGTGRDEGHIALVEAYSREAGLWFDPAAEPRFTRVVDIDLSTVGMHVAGPRRPQDLLGFHQTAEALEGLAFTPTRVHPQMPKHAIAIAAITSCTNTSDPRLLVAAGLVARKARALGLSVPAWSIPRLHRRPTAASYWNAAASPTTSPRSAFQTSATAAPPASAIRGRCRRSSRRP